VEQLVDVTSAAFECVPPAIDTSCPASAVDHGFDVVPVAIEHERAVVRGVVLGSQPRRAEVLAAGSERCAVERVDNRLGSSPGRSILRRLTFLRRRV
jgi:hypothetical protein